MKIARVFPRRTSATPDDELAFVGDPPLFLPTVDEVHVSCTFTWDKPEAERQARAWANFGYKVVLGGPAYGSPAGDFTPGMYVKVGMTITSRGCIRRCPFCFVPLREGKLRLLDIKPGWDILDNNLLACPRPHIDAVLDMLEGQPRAARFADVEDGLGAAVEKATIGVTGTFNAANLLGLQAGDADDRITNAAEKTAKGIDGLRKDVRNNRAVFV